MALSERLNELLEQARVQIDPGEYLERNEFGDSRPPSRLHLGG